MRSSSWLLFLGEHKPSGHCFVLRRSYRCLRLCRRLVQRCVLGFLLSTSLKFAIVITVCMPIYGPVLCPFQAPRVQSRPLPLCATGGHLNPAISLAFFLSGKISLLRTVLYIICQCVGAIVGSAIVSGVRQPVHVTLFAAGATPAVLCGPHT